MGQAKCMEEGTDLSVSPKMSGGLHNAQGQASYVPRTQLQLPLIWCKGQPPRHCDDWLTVLPPTLPHPILALTSSGSQMTVEGNISLAHGQEVRADI